MSGAHLFKRLADTSGENCLTEALAILLSSSSAFKLAFLGKLGIPDQPINLRTQERDAEDGGKPDLQLSCPTHFVLLEVKEDAPLSIEQWKRYQDILGKKQCVGEKRLYAIVAPWTRIDDVITAAESPGRILQWADIYRLAENASRQENDAVAVFLLGEFMLFLEDRQMKPFGQFTDDDLTVIKGLHNINLKFASFFLDVFHKLVGLIGGTSELRNKGYEMNAYRSSHDMYPGLHLGFKWKSLDVSSWIGLECGEENLQFSFWVWTDEMWHRTAISKDVVRLKQILVDAGFRWDDSDGYYLRMKASLNGKDDVETLANEVGATLKPLLTGSKLT